jgi:hypothetical protein
MEALTPFERENSAALWASKNWRSALVATGRSTQPDFQAVKRAERLWLLVKLIRRQAPDVLATQDIWVEQLMSEIRSTLLNDAETM